MKLAGGEGDRFGQRVAEGVVEIVLGWHLTGCSDATHWNAPAVGMVGIRGLVVLHRIC